jgi:hypothetical protein
VELLSAALEQAGVTVDEVRETGIWRAIIGSRAGA